jgi:uncharacterized protein YcbK (DUF882 family)
MPSRAAAPRGAAVFPRISRHSRMALALLGFAAASLGVAVTATAAPTTKPAVANNANTLAKTTPKIATKPLSRSSGEPLRSTGASKAKAKRGALPPVLLFHVNHRESLRLRLDERGRPGRGLQRQVDNLLRCHYTKRRKAMHPRLTRLLLEIGKHYPGRRIEVVSGYRHPKFAKNPHSPHMKGLACDMRVAGIKNTELRDFFRQRFKSVGVGYYPNSSFVHLDVRRGASAFWIDYSGPGQNAVYAKNALEDLRSGRAERWRRTTIDPSWADEEDVQSDVRLRADDSAPGDDEAPVEGMEVNDESGGDMPVGP